MQQIQAAIHKINQGVVNLKKKITSTIYVEESDGKVQCWDDMTEEKKKEISIKLNRKAMESIGYRVKEKANS